ncbi:MAG: Ig-like domain-containing protein [Parabacteroides sp.]|nr:Ig-like domain-containing protein [Parabacteroides sp.]
MPKKTGICLNIGNCSKARKKEIQTVEAANFVCEECGRELKEKKAKGGGPNWKPIVGGVAAAAILGTGGYFIWSSGGGDTTAPKTISLNKQKSELVVGATDTLEVVFTPEKSNATVRWASNNSAVVTVVNGVVTAVAPGTAKIGVQVNENKELKAFCEYEVKVKVGGDFEPDSGTDLGYAVWTGAVDEKGLPHDTNGRMYFKARQRISPKDDQERYAEEGDSVVGEYIHGKLVQGKWYKKDGNVEVIMIGQ